MEPLKEIVVIYHDHCPDGTAAAWAAWVKYGEKASYIPAGYGDPLPEDIEGKEVYVVDFSYSGDLLLELEKKAKSLVVIDHHKGSEERVVAVKSHVFDTNRSGAYLAWEYFQKGLKMPKIIEYISAGDLFHMDALPDTAEALAYVYALPRTFEAMNKLFEEFDDESKWNYILEKGKLLLQYRDVIIETPLDGIHFVEIEGITMPAVNVALPISEKSYLLNKIYTKIPPVALAYRYIEGEWRCSLRSNKNFDCTELAKKFGGGGHPGSAGFSIKTDNNNFPFKVVPVPEIFIKTIENIKY